MSCCNTHTAVAVPVTGEVRPAEPRSPVTFRPSADVVDTRSEIVVQIDMPGVRSESVEIEVEGGTLTISGRVAPRIPPEGSRWLVREYGVGDFRRVFTLGDGVDRSNIRAEMAQGVLTLRLEKAAAAKARRIPVTVAAG
ncbi:MAG: Hsp20/alpha crystallin family protein [Phycisphaerales bacterium]|nr:Hsp20/alpha crystallin family protein [Phycisphaerales bacterium]